MDAAILCGGQSLRMGRNKAFLSIQGRPLIERQIEVLRRTFDRILLVTRSLREYEYLAGAFQETTVELVSDAVPGQGSMVGIYSGLLSMQGRAGFFVACDMPFLNEDLIRFMVGLSEAFDIVIPQSQGGAFLRQSGAKTLLEPTHAVYSKACLGPMEAQMTTGDYKIIHFFSQVRVRAVSEEETRRFDPRGLALANVNTEEEYKRYCAITFGS